MPPHNLKTSTLNANPNCQLSTLNSYPTMTKKKQLDQLQRLVSLIADDNELLSRANTFMQNLVDTRLEVHGKHDLSSQLQQTDKHTPREKPHQ